MTAQDVLQQCTVEGNVVKLPEGQLDRKLYMDVAKALDLIGGKWKGGKVMGFVFAEDPSDLLQQIAGGEVRNLKKEYQFFATPEHLADRIFDEFKKLKGTVNTYDEILEPSAGQGALLDALLRAFPNVPVHNITAIELMPTNVSILRTKPYAAGVIEGDYLQTEFKKKFDFIIANPPFTKNQDIDHIRKMYGDLEINGTLVTLCSVHPFTSSNRKEREFVKWLDSLSHTIIDIPEGEFKTSGTSIATKLIFIFNLPF